MAEEIGFENGRNSNFQGLVTLTLTLDPAITAYRRASLIDLYLYTKFHWNRRNFLWTDGRTFSPSNIIRSTFGSRPKKLKSDIMHYSPPAFVNLFLPQDHSALMYFILGYAYPGTSLETGYIADGGSVGHSLWTYSLPDMSPDVFPPRKPEGRTFPPHILRKLPVGICWHPRVTTQKLSNAIYMQVFTRSFVS